MFPTKIRIAWPFSTCDDKSAFQHVLLHPSSRTFFGFYGKDSFLFSVRSLLVGKLALSGFKSLVLRFLRLLIPLASRSPNTLRTDALASSWNECLLWRTEHHAVVTLFTDASSKTWGGSLRKNGQTFESRDYWSDDFYSQDIHTLETLALFHSLRSFKDLVSSCRVDLHTDSLVLKTALENDECRSSSVNSVLKDNQLQFLIQTIW